MILVLSRRPSYVSVNVVDDRTVVNKRAHTLRIHHGVHSNRTDIGSRREQQMTLHVETII